jgi:hypothetical protein
MKSALTLRSIDPTPFKAMLGGLGDCEPGPAPQLQWIEIGKLVVDTRYQRDLGKTGAKNIVRIAREFEWSKFAPVVVAPIEGGQWAIVDGQHRTTAAALRGITEVPCQVIIADPRKQAAAFAAINANVTEMSPMQVHAAKVAAGDETSLKLQAVCAEAGVHILRYPVQTTTQKVGDTMAVSMLYRMFAKFGADVLVAALSCITRSRDGYPGMVRSQLVSALCVVLEAEPEWCESRKLLKAIGKLDLRQAFADACKSATPGSGGGIVAELVDLISAHLEAEIPIKGEAA